MLRLTNTLTRKKEEFLPPRSRVRCFVCGPTVYGPSHIGHARTYVFFDVAVKYLRKEGYDVHYLQNITDIDDKIINRAKDLDLNWQEVSRTETERYYADMKRIKVDAVSKYILASAHIHTIKSQIERLIQKGRAYSADGSVYFDISTFPDFGKLSGQDRAALQKAERTGEDAAKKHQHDFVLWRGRTGISGEPSWDSPWGPGRPGWHIEDTAITEAEFGPQYDLHGGGVELMFPHHEAEIAQMESISGLYPFVRYWVHTGWVTVRGEKMSKSLGNFITIEEILKKYSPEALRLLMLQTHYRGPLEYSEEQMGAADNRVQKLKEFRALIRLIERKGPYGTAKTRLDAEETNASHPLHAFKAAMDDDFNTAHALSAFDLLISDCNELISAGTPPSRASVQRMFNFFEYVNSLFGILPYEMPIPPEITDRAEKRESARQAKKWGEADAIRKEMAERGYLVSDTPFGPVIIEK